MPAVFSAATAGGGSAAGSEAAAKWKMMARTGAMWRFMMGVVAV